MVHLKNEFYLFVYIKLKNTIFLSALYYYLVSKNFNRFYSSIKKFNEQIFKQSIKFYSQKLGHYYPTATAYLIQQFFIGQMWC